MFVALFTVPEKKSRISTIRNFLHKRYPTKKEGTTQENILKLLFSSPLPISGSPRSSSKAVRSKFKSESALLLYALYQQAVAWIVLGIFSLIRFQADYLLVIGVCLTLSIANIVGFTKCRKGVQASPI